MNSGTLGLVIIWAFVGCVMIRVRLDNVRVRMRISERVL